MSACYGEGRQKYTQEPQWKKARAERLIGPVQYDRGGADHWVRQSCKASVGAGVGKAEGRAEAEGARWSLLCRITRRGRDGSEVPGSRRRLAKGARGALAGWQARRARSSGPLGLRLPAVPHWKLEGCGVGGWSEWKRAVTGCRCLHLRAPGLRWSHSPPRQNGAVGCIAGVCGGARWWPEWQVGGVDGVDGVYGVYGAVTTAWAESSRTLP